VARSDDDEQSTDVRAGEETDPESTLEAEDRFDDGPATLIKPDERDHEPLTVVKIVDERPPAQDGGLDDPDSRDSFPSDSLPSDTADDESPEPQTAVRESAPEHPEQKTDVMAAFKEPDESTMRLSDVLDAEAMPEPKTDKIPPELLQALAARKPRPDEPHAPPATQDAAVLRESPAPMPAVEPFQQLRDAPSWVRALAVLGAVCAIFIVWAGVRAASGDDESSAATPDEDSSGPGTATGTDDDPVNVSSTANATAAPATPPALPASSADAASSAEASSVAGSAEMEARAALERFRKGIEPCIVDTILALPGTSRAVPPGLAFLARGPHQSLANDWRTPVYACAKFSIETPQRFVIQWQLDKVKRVGLAVVWTDENHDGKADLALGFTGKLDGDDKLQLSEITRLDPIPAVARRY